MTQDTDIHQETRHPRKLDTGLIWAVLFLALGAAMLIWPDLLAASSVPCSPDELIGCFISNSWGTSLGAALSFSIGVLLGLSAVWKFIRRKNGQPIPHDSERS